MKSRAWLILSLIVIAAPEVQAAKIRLQDGTEFSGEVLAREHDSLIVRLPRQGVASVDGKALPPAVTKGIKAPDFAAVDLSGTTQHLDSDPKQPTLIQFWATWCPHCRSDIGLMRDLWARYKGKGLRILSISIDQKLDALTSFVQQHDLQFPVIAAEHQPGNLDRDIPERYENRGVPAYFLIDKRGVIRSVYSGAIVETNADLVGEIEAVLAEAATRSARRR